MKLVITILTILVVAIAASPSFAAGDAAAGKAVFAKQCASCHGPNGDGNATIAKMLKVELRPLGSKEVQAKSDAELKKQMTEGVGKMKPVKGLDEKAQDDVLAFLRTLKK